jgi:hypothetical protein
LRGAFCVLVATILALNAHVYVQAWAQEEMGRITQGAALISPPETALPIIAASYVTAFITAGVLALTYYWVGDRLPIGRRPLKAIALALLLLEFKGSLLRMPIMNAIVYAYAGAHSPVTLALLGQIDMWAANLLLAFCLVYLCPIRYTSSPAQ